MESPMKMRDLILFALLACSATALAKTVDVQIRIRPEGNDEKIITRDNLIRIKQFILKNGQKETYCNMYNNNPAYHTKGFHFYLNPDSGQENINCDPAKSDFNNLTIRSEAGTKNQYRTIDFLRPHDISVSADWPTDDLTVSQLRQVTQEALLEILKDIDTAEHAHQPATLPAATQHSQP